MTCKSGYSTLHNMVIHIHVPFTRNVVNVIAIPLNWLNTQLWPCVCEHRPTLPVVTLHKLTCRSSGRCSKPAWTATRSVDSPWCSSACTTSLRPDWSAGLWSKVSKTRDQRKLLSCLIVKQSISTGTDLYRRCTVNKLLIELGFLFILWHQQ